VELESPQANGLDRNLAPELRVLRPTEQVNPLGDPNVSQQLNPWDSFFLRMTLSWLVVLVPFFVLAGVFNLAQQGLWLEIVALLLLVGIMALSTWWNARPVLALSAVATAIESGDLSVRAVPGGGGQTRRLAHAVNRLLDHLAIELPRIRTQATETSGRLAVSAQRLGTATAEQIQAAG
jgi:methyl-accepting chemotaxis protein